MPVRTLIAVSRSASVARFRGLTEEFEATSPRSNETRILLPPVKGLHRGSAKNREIYPCWVQEARVFLPNKWSPKELGSVHAHRDRRSVLSQAE